MGDAGENVRERVDPSTGSLTFPLYQTSAYLMPQGEKYRYSREANPTVEELNRILSGLEHAESTVSFSSGMGAITTTLLSLLKPGMKLVVTRDCFARTFRFSTQFLRDFGVHVSVSDPGTEHLVPDCEDTDIVLVESISNPILRVYDIEKIAKSVHAHDGVLIVDATMATPVNQKPLELGADVVIHSLSKFISGHNDIIGGSASGKNELMEKIDAMRRTFGTSMDPNTAFLTIRGLKTLKVRMQTINSSALAIARMASENPGFEAVRYPGLESHPDYLISRRELTGYGGVVTFDVRDASSNAMDSLSKLRLISPANTLGGANSTISHPATMSHRSLSVDERTALGFSNKTFRLSVGLEDPVEIFSDLIRMFP